MSETLKTSGEQTGQPLNGASVLEEMPTFEEMQNQQSQQQDKENDLTEKTPEKTAENDVPNTEGLEANAPEDAAKEENQTEQFEDKRKAQIEMYKATINDAQDRYYDLLASGKKERAEILKMDIEQAQKELGDIVDGTMIGNGTAPTFNGDSMLWGASSSGEGS